MWPLLHSLFFQGAPPLWKTLIGFFHFDGLAGRVRSAGTRVVPALPEDPGILTPGSVPRRP